MAKFCTKCGAQITDGAKFCEKCGNPAGTLKEQPTEKKSSVLRNNAWLVLLIVAAVVVLYVTGVIGGKDGTVQTNSRTESVQKPQEQPAKQPTTEPTESPETDADSEAKMLEAYEAYKKYIEEDEKIYEDYCNICDIDENDYEEGEDYYGDFRSYIKKEYFSEEKYSLIQLDADDYPEMFVTVNYDSTTLFYTYKNGEVKLVGGNYDTREIYNISYSYREKQGKIFVEVERRGTTSYFGTFDGESVTKDAEYSWYDWESSDLITTIDEEDVSEDEYKKRFAEQKGDETAWTSVAWDSNMDGAFIKLQQSDS